MDNRKKDIIYPTSLCDVFWAVHVKQPLSNLFDSIAGILTARQLRQARQLKRIAQQFSRHAAVAERFDRPAQTITRMYYRDFFGHDKDRSPFSLNEVLSYIEDNYHNFFIDYRPEFGGDTIRDKLKTLIDQGAFDRARTYAEEAPHQGHNKTVMRYE